MAKVIAALSDNGWTTDSKTILSTAIINYILTDAAQSVSFQGNLINMPEAYYMYINQPDEMAYKMKSDLELLLSRYFENVEVTCYPKKITESKYAIVFNCGVIGFGGERVQITKIAEMSNNLRKVVDVNNYGEAMTIINRYGE